VFELQSSWNNIHDRFPTGIVQGTKIEHTLPVRQLYKFQQRITTKIEEKNIQTKRTPIAILSLPVLLIGA
jgi:hypothetical protein